MILATHEHQRGDDLGIKIQLDADARMPDSFSEAGERVAGQNRARAPNVWVWTYAHDMDLEGPAVCVSYIGPDAEGAVTEFFDPKTLLTYYRLKQRIESEA